MYFNAYMLTRTHGRTLPPLGNAATRQRATHPRRHTAAVGPGRAPIGPLGEYRARAGVPELPDYRQGVDGARRRNRSASSPKNLPGPQDRIRGHHRAAHAAAVRAYWDGADDRQRRRAAGISYASAVMGELCLRWAMKLPADTPINWPPHVAPAMDRIRAALLAMDDVRDLPRLSNNHLARHTGLSEATVRKALAR